MTIVNSTGAALAVLGLLVACGTAKPTDAAATADGAAGADSGRSGPAADAAISADSSTDAESGDSGSDANALITTTIATAVGTMTYSIVVGGGAPCSTTIDVDGVEDASTPWRCPDCAHLFTSPRKSTSDCPPGPALAAGHIRDAPQTIGWTADGKFYASGGYGQLNKVGTAVEIPGGVTATLSISFTDGAGVTTKVTGSANFKLGTTQGDALHGWRRSEVYACGWPHGDAEPFTGTYLPKLHGQLPDGVFLDRCGDKVRLHDFLGSYLVIQANQTTVGTCSYCASGASGQKSFEKAMLVAAVPTVVVTLMVPQYNWDDMSATPKAMAEWATMFNVMGPVLADRGFANVVFESAKHNDNGFGYPEYMVVSPSGEILAVEPGFSPGNPGGGTWDKLAKVITKHAGQ